MVNNPGDLWALLSVMDRRRFRSYWNFVNEWCDITTTPWATEVGQLSKGKEEAFSELLAEFSMRRTLADIPSLADLEERHRHYMVTLPPSVKKMIATAKKDYIVEHEDLEKSQFVSNGGALYAQLRQLSTNPPTKIKPKIDFLRELMEDRAGPLVVYVWYKDSARAVAESLTRTNRTVTLITGDTPTNRRTALVDEWKAQKDGVLVATIASLKEGISLVHSSDVVFLEHSELPADQAQCVARLKRRGQTELVNVYHVWAKGTPDTAIKRANVEREVGLKRALAEWLQED
jgi:SNF2 family DNA or RNA helicase